MKSARNLSSLDLFIILIKLMLSHFLRKSLLHLGEIISRFYESNIFQIYAF